MKTQKAWNKGKKIWPKPPLTMNQVQLIKMLLNEKNRLRDLLLFSFAIDTSLRGCDLVNLKVADVNSNGEVQEIFSIQQQKTTSRVACHITSQTQVLLQEWIQTEKLMQNDYLFSSSRWKIGHLSKDHYAYLLKNWLVWAGLDPMKYGTHSLRRTKIALIYQKTGNLRVCQKLLWHSSIQHTANYLGIEESEALEIARQVKI